MIVAALSLAVVGALWLFVWLHSRHEIDLHQKAERERVAYGRLPDLGLLGMANYAASNLLSGMGDYAPSNFVVPQRHVEVRRVRVRTHDGRLVPLDEFLRTHDGRLVPLDEFLDRSVQ